MAPNSQRHLYPMKIALRAQRLIQGILFYDVFTDTATWLFASTNKDAEKLVQEHLINHAGWRKDTYEISWQCFSDYLNEYQHPIRQHAVFSMISQWDWFISKLGKFIYFAEKSNSPQKATSKELLKLNKKPFKIQLEVIKSQISISFDENEDAINLIHEMHLVRNLGMHNNWEVDDIYLEGRLKCGFKLGDKREFEISELERWHKALIQLIDKLASETALYYANAPFYE